MIKTNYSARDYVLAHPEIKRAALIWTWAFDAVIVLIRLEDLATIKYVDDPLTLIPEGYN